MTKKFLTKIGAGMATGGMILAALGPTAAFADTVTVAGNFASLNVVGITKTLNATVTKTNVATTTNTVGTIQSSGGNASLLGGGIIVSGANASTTIIGNTTTQSQ